MHTNKGLKGMRRFTRRLIPDSSFFHKLLMLAGGTIAGQALVVLSSPLLTRLFTPAEFGAFTVLAAVTGICSVGIALRFEFAIPIIERDEDAAAMVVVTALAAVTMAALVALAIWLWGPWLADLIGVPAWAFLLWLLPPALLAWGCGSALSYWSVRRRRFATNGLNHTLQLGSQAGGQVALGLAGSGVWGLMLGYVLGYVVRLGHYAARLPAADRRLIRSTGGRRLWRVARESWRYPTLAFPSSLLQSLCNLAPAILVAALFGPVVAGWYGLGQRVMGLPVRMLSEAASHVFLGEVRALDERGLHRFFLRVVVLFTALGALGAVPVLLAGPALFALVFGEPWREAGVLVQLLLPLYVARFVVLPVSQLLYVLKRQDIHLFSAALNAAALGLSFGGGYALDLDHETTILMFSTLSGLSFVVYLAITWLLSHRRGGGLQAVPGASA